MTKVSIAMGVYNGSKYIKDSIESMLVQTFNDFEFIICDDCSSDNTIEIIREYMRKDNRIILIRNTKNMGLAYSLNRCIEIAKGEYIARMDDDDISLETRLEKQVKILDENLDVAMVCGGMRMFDENGVWGIRIDKMPMTKENIYKYNPIPHPTVMIRKSVLKELGGYTVNKDTLRCEDYDLWCRMYSCGYKVYYIKELLLNYRENNDSLKKRNYQSRVSYYRIKIKCRRILNLPIYYNIYALRPLFVGILPNYIMKKMHRKKFKI